MTLKFQVTCLISSRDLKVSGYKLLESKVCLVGGEKSRVASSLATRVPSRVINKTHRYRYCLIRRRRRPRLTPNAISTHNDMQTPNLNVADSSTSFLRIAYYSYVEKTELNGFLGAAVNNVTAAISLYKTKSFIHYTIRQKKIIPCNHLDIGVLWLPTFVRNQIGRQPQHIRV